MKRLWLAGPVCLFLLAAVAHGSTLGALQSEMTGLFEKVNPSVVTVRYTPGSGAFKEMVSTGVIVDKKGHILTMKDLPSDAKRVEVVLSNGEKRKADFIGHDPESKVQILKTSAKGLSPAAIGDPGRVKAGSWVLIVGNSYGVSPSLSLGLISGRREKGLIQLSGELSPGMSGAGVYNLKGELIGVVSATISRPFYFTMGGLEGRFEVRRGMDLPSQGPGLVIPIDRAKKLAVEIIEKGEVEHGWLGVYIDDLDEDLMQDLNIKEGVLVTRVAAESPAEKAGIEEDDIIREFKGQKVKDVESLRSLVSDTKPGKKVRVTVLRDGKRKTLTAKIAKKTWEKGVYSFDFLPFMTEPLDKLHMLESDKLKDDLKKLKEELKELKKEFKNLKKERI